MSVVVLLWWIKMFHFSTQLGQNSTYSDPHRAEIIIFLLIKETIYIAVYTTTELI